MAGVLVGLLVRASVTPAADSPVSNAAMLGLLDRYAARDYAGAARAIEAIRGRDAAATAQEIAKAFEAWRAVTPGWMAAGPAPAAAGMRALVAATAALDIARAHPDLDEYVRLRFFTWACETLRAHPGASNAERLWYLLSVAYLEDSHESLLVPPASDPFRSPLAYRFAARLTAPDHAEMLSGHLSHARAAFPDEPRFALAELRTRLRAVTRPQAGTSPHWIGAFEYPVRDGTTIAEQAAKTSVGLGPLPSIARDLDALGRSDRVRADVQLALGDLAIRVRAWEDARQHLDEVARLTTEPFLVGMSHYLRGWVDERNGRREDAIAQYRLALAQLPHARSLSILLSVQLAETGQQADAYDILDAGLKANLGPRQTVADPLELRADPWALFQRGDAWRVPSYLAELREALR